MMFATGRSVGRALRRDWLNGVPASCRPCPARGHARRSPAHGGRQLSTSSRQPASIKLPSTLRQTLHEFRAETGTYQSSDEVTVHGWIRGVRKHGKLVFLDISDGTLLGSQTLQAVLKGEAKKLIGPTWSVGAAVKLSGHLSVAIPSKGAAGSSTVPTTVELAVKDGTLVGCCDSAAYPLQATSTVETIRQHAHLRHRRQRDAAVLRARARIENGMAEWFQRNDFTHVVAPVITSSDCEGAGEVFQVVADADVNASAPPDASQSLAKEKGSSLHSFWSGSPAYLTVSSQLHLEAMSLAISRVWTTTSAFRAEHSATNRHLAEFRMCEAEMAWTDSLQTVLDCVQGSVMAAIQGALLAHPSDSSERHPDAALLFAGTSGTAGESLYELVRDCPAAHEDAAPWPRITYTEAVERLNSTMGASIAWGESLASEHERWLAAEIGRGPLFVTDYPASMKPFYMRRNSPTDGSSPGPTVACFDLLIPGLGELAGGSLREEREEVLLQTMVEKGLLSSPTARHGLQWYSQSLRRYGSAPHGGFGLGVERLVSWLTATENVRDCVPFPRTVGPVRF